MKVLLPGGAGYIGSHTTLELLRAGHEVIVLDNLVNASVEALLRVEALSGKRVTFIEGDVRDEAFLERVFTTHDLEAVINFASLKAVGESVSNPLAYYDNNIIGAVTLLRVMARHHVKKFIFSSSATVYGDPERLPLDEDCRISATSPYGRTKIMVEEILKDLVASDKDWEVVVLRYFNPVGAHESGLIGEDPTGVPNNLLPFVSQVAVGRRPEVRIFGSDYPTPDGTGVRDYLHVVDLALGHLAALSRFGKGQGLETFNLGTGKGISVIEVIDAFAQASGQTIKRVFCDRRPGDVASCYTDPSKAEKILGWKATRSLADMCTDAWNWQSKNPQGYRK